MQSVSSGYNLQDISNHFFFWKKKQKNTTNLSSAEFVQRVVKVILADKMIYFFLFCPENRI